ncbi:hypothetical protein FE236_01020 [Mariprofundus erugo]|nr:hypothetical protein FE236_01020 [Mariprofundus erugo]
MGRGMTPEQLKSIQRKLRDGFPEDMSLRVHRAISWLQRAAAEKDDHDVAFILLWVAFNACYADDEGGFSSSRERDKSKVWFEKALRLDDEAMVHDAVWTKFNGPIRKLLGNPYVFQPYWNDRNGIPGYENWQDSFDGAKVVAKRSLDSQNTATLLSIVFNRLNVLRNQLIHGGATWNSQVNREQVKEGRMILAFLLPCFIEIMMNNPHEDWGKPFYPVVGL